MQGIFEIVFFIMEERMKIEQTYTILYDNRENYLYVHISGLESYEAAVSFWHELEKKTTKENIDKIIVVDEVSGRLNALKHYEISIIIANLFPGKKIAFVDPKQDTFELNKFGETVVFNRGGIALVCRSEAEGLEWLLNEI
jgi:hypothetical protein